MGCHTWFCKKEERSIEDARRIWIKRRKLWISDWRRITYDVVYDKNGNFLKANDKFRLSQPDYTQDKCIAFLKLYKRQLKMVERGLCSVAVMNDQPEHSYYNEGRGFFVVLKDYHDLFRIGNYPNDWLYSKEECMEFIKQNIQKIQIYDNTYQKLDEFWNKYPDGCIHFG